MRVNAVVGAQASTLETNYNVRPLTTAQIVSTIFPFTSLKNALQEAERKLVTAIANTGNHPWRQYLAGVTGNLAHKAALPTTSAASKQIVGIWGSIYDASDGVPCREKPLGVITRRVRNSGSFYRTPVYYYKLDGGRIYHTRTNVIIDCCVYDDAAQTTAINSNTAMLLPDVLADALVSGAVSMLVRDDEFTQQAALYRGYFNDWLGAINNGMVSVSSKVIPNPTLGPLNNKQ